MRKDVRMGFAVGGVLLAVIIVAVLVVHRNHNPKTVAFDSGQGTSSSSTPNTTDVTAPNTPDKSADSPAPQAPAADRPAIPPKTQGPSDSSPPAASEKAADTRWDALFASTADDPIKAQLAQRSTARPRERAAARSTPSREFDTSGENSVATVLDRREGPNAPVDASTAAPVVGESSDSTSAGTGRGSAGVGHTHRVQPGETFVSIARAAYGDGRYYRALQSANPTIDANKLRPGMTIQLPPASQVKRSSRAAAKDSADSAGPANTSRRDRDSKSYVVQKNDSLYSIARKELGHGDKADELYTLNKQVIGPDSTKLKPGMVLRIP